MAALLLGLVRPVADVADRLTRIVIGLMLALIVGVLFYEVFARYLFYRPTQWSDQLARFTFIWMIMLGVGLCTRHDEHLRLALFDDVRSRGLRLALAMVDRLATLGLFAFVGWMAYQTLPVAGRQMALGLGVSWIWAYAAIPTGSALVVLFTIERLLEDVAHGPRAPADLGER
jgi:TRAP-type transport system small permease protein